MFLIRSKRTADTLILTPALEAPETDAPKDAEWRERCHRLCRQLAEHGMELVDAAIEENRRAHRTDTVAEQDTRSIIFCRLCLAVRQAIALEARLLYGQVIRPHPAGKHRDRTGAGTPPRVSPADKLDPTLAYIADEKIPALLTRIGKALGVTVQPARKTPATQPTPKSPAPEPQQAAAGEPPTAIVEPDEPTQAPRQASRPPAPIPAQARHHLPKPRHRLPRPTRRIGTGPPSRS